MDNVREVAEKVELGERANLESGVIMCKWGRREGGD